MKRTVCFIMGKNYPLSQYIHHIRSVGSVSTVGSVWEFVGLTPATGKHSFIEIGHEMNLVLRKPVLEVSDQVQHKPACTCTEDG